MKPTHAAVLLLSTLSPSALAQNWLDAPRELLQANGEFLADVADLDGDGRLDFLVKRASISIDGISGFYPLLATGPYTYAAGPNVPASPVGFEGEAYVIAGDVTGDGLPDVVTSLRELSGSPGFGFRVYVNQGGGTFAAPIHTSINGLPKAAAFSDWDHDGTKEIVTATTIVVPGMPFVTDLCRWTWNGSGFAPSVPAVDPDFFEALSVADVTGDGVDDVVVGSSGSNVVRLYPTVANGNFGAPTAYVVGTSTPYGVRVPSCGDVDGDGDIDAVVTWIGGSFMTDLAVLTNDGTGNLTVGPVQTFVLEPGLYWDGENHLADWDGDGDLDAILSWDSLLFLENDANVFTFRGWFEIGVEDDGGVGAGTADFDGDGFVDYAAGRVVKYGNGTIEDASDGAPSPALQVVDHDGDGDLDFVEQGGDVYVNDATGHFTTIPAPWPPDVSPFFLTGVAAFGDFTGNGTEDVVVELRQFITPFSTQFVDLRVLERKPDGTYAFFGVASTTDFTDFVDFRLRHVDLDGDGDVDIAQKDGWRENNGVAGFDVLHSDFTGLPVALADVDGDGRNDVVTYATDSSGASMHTLWRNQPTGFVAEVLASENSASGNLAQRSYLADGDQDGDLDFFVGTPVGGPAVIVRENVGGAFGPPATLASIGFAYETLGFDDFDGDGLTDLIGARQNSNVGGTAVIWRRVGPGLQYAAPVPYFANPVGTALDLDGDGDLDLIGRRPVRSARHTGDAAGRIRQYGAGSPGPSGVTPVLGVKGPARAGEVAELRFRRAQGGAISVFAYGPSAAEIADLPLPGMTLLVAPVTVAVVLPLGGSPGVPAVGSLDVPFLVPPALVGVRHFMQFFAQDGAGAAASNGVEVLYGP